MTAYETAVSAPVTTLEKVLAGCAHGSMLLGIPFLIPIGTLLFASFVQPSDYVKTQSVQAIAFHLLTGMIFAVLLIAAAGFGFFGLITAALAAQQAGTDMVPPANWGIAVLLAIGAFLFLGWASIIALVATVRGFQGHPYRYPLVGRLFP